MTIHMIMLLRFAPSYFTPNGHWGSALCTLSQNTDSRERERGGRENVPPCEVLVVHQGVEVSVKGGKLVPGNRFSSLVYQCNVTLRLAKRTFLKPFPYLHAFGGRISLFPFPLPGLPCDLGNDRSHL